MQLLGTRKWWCTRLSAQSLNYATAIFGTHTLSVDKDRDQKWLIADCNQTTSAPGVSQSNPITETRFFFYKHTYKS